MQTRDRLCKECPESKAAEDPAGRGAEAQEGSGRGKSRLKIRDLFADGMCSQAALDFLSTTDMGSLVAADEGARARC